MPSVSTTPRPSSTRVARRAWLLYGLLVVGCDGAADEAPVVPIETLDASADGTVEPADAIVDAIMDATSAMDATCAMDVVCAMSDVMPGVMPDVMPDAMSDAMLDAMPDAGCAPDCPVVVWRDGPPLTRVSDHHTTAVLGEPGGAALYVLGGIATDPQGGIEAITDEIQRADIGPDGLPDPYTLHGRLPFALAFHGQAIGPDVIHLAAGVRLAGGRPTGSAAIIALPHGPGDALGEPVECAEGLPQGVVHPTAERVGDRLVVIGGTRRDPVDEVWVAEVGPDGCPLPFVAAPALPEPRSHHVSAVVDGRILVLGGFGAGQAARTDILASTHGAEGAIEGWAVVGTVEPAPWTAAAIVHDDWLWLVGGGEGNGFAARFVDTVRRAPLVDGLPGDFEVVDQPLPVGRSHVHQTPLFDGRIYSVGGRVFREDFTMTSIDSTFVGTLRAD